MKTYLHVGLTLMLAAPTLSAPTLERPGFLASAVTLANDKMSATFNVTNDVDQGGFGTVKPKKTISNNLFMLYCSGTLVGRAVARCQHLRRVCMADVSMLTQFDMASLLKTKANSLNCELLDPAISRSSRMVLLLRNTCGRRRCWARARARPGLTLHPPSAAAKLPPRVLLVRRRSV